MSSMPETTTGPKSPDPLHMAIIAVAVEELWPKPTIEEDVHHKAETVWRFANRWWSGGGVDRRRPSRPSSFS